MSTHFYSPLENVPRLAKAAVDPPTLTVVPSLLQMSALSSSTDAISFAHAEFLLHIATSVLSLCPVPPLVMVIIQRFTSTGRNSLTKRLGTVDEPLGISLEFPTLGSQSFSNRTDAQGECFTKELAPRLLISD